MKKIWQEFKSFIKMISKGKKDVAVVMAHEFLYSNISSPV